MKWLQRHWLQLAANVGALLPLIVLAWRFFQGQLSVNPIQDIILYTGKWALVLLVFSLACTPVHIIFGLRQVLPLRRTLGLYAFGYASLHLLTFVGLDYGFQLGRIVQEAVEKRYILAGFAAFLILLPLAITSTRGWVRRLGKRWKRLHQLVYLAAILAIVHYVWLVKADIREPLLYGAMVAVLLVVRLAPVRRAITGLRHRVTEE